MKSLAPDGAMEIQLAQRIATDSWRLNRISAIEDNLFALGVQENGGKLCPEYEQIDAALTTAHVSRWSRRISSSLRSTSSASTGACKRTSPSCNPSRPAAKQTTKPP